MGTKISLIDHIYFVIFCTGCSGAQIGRKCLVVASMVTAIVSAIAGGILLIMSTTYLSLSETCVQLVSFALLVAMGTTMLIIAIASASLTCLPLCCRPKKQAGNRQLQTQIDNVPGVRCLCLSLCQIILFCLCFTSNVRCVAALPTLTLAPWLDSLTTDLEATMLRVKIQKNQLSDAAPVQSWQQIWDWIG